MLTYSPYKILGIEKVCRYVDQKGSAAKLTSVHSAGVAPEVNVRKSVEARKHASEKSTLALKPRADVTRGPKQPLARQELIPPPPKKSLIYLSLVFICINIHKYNCNLVQKFNLFKQNQMLPN